jgi:hypothetical protein
MPIQLACMEALAEDDRLRQIALAWSEAGFRALLNKQASAEAFVEMIRPCFEANPELTSKMLRSDSGAVRPPDWAVTPLAAAEPPTDDRPTLAAAVGSAVRAVLAEIVRQRYDRGGDLREKSFVGECAATAGGKPSIGAPRCTETDPTADVA